MALEWTEKIAVGVEMIDDQHKELFQRTNMLLETCKKGGSDDEVHKALEFLQQYVKKHLHDEEALQVQYNYPEREAHIEQHKIFLQKVADIQSDLDLQGATLVNTIKTTNLFVSWLSKHISHEDKKFGDYLSTVM